MKMTGIRGCAVILVEVRMGTITGELDLAGLFA
jgi:hypothetical protein